MRYILKQKLLSWSDDYYIKDASERDVYFVDGKAFSFGSQLSFKDLDGNELAFIKQKVFSLGKTFEIFRNGEVAAVVKKELFSFIHHRFSVDVPGPDDLEAAGNFLDYEFTFKRGDRVVASVSKTWFSWTDTYGVEIDDSEDQVLILAAAVVVDQACHTGEEGSH